jgi:hypothetical protein
VEPTIGLSPERALVGIAKQRGLSPEGVSWQRFETYRFFAPLISTAGVDAAIVTLNLIPSAVEIYTTAGGIAYTDSATITLKLTPSGIDTYTTQATLQAAILATPSALPPVIVPGLPYEYKRLVHYTHEGKALGEVYPLSLDFAKYLNRIGYVNYDIDGGHDLARKEHTSPYETDFVLSIGNNNIMGGEHTSVSLHPQEEGGITVAGQDWGHWIERQLWPFDPDDPLGNTYLVTDRDIALVVKDLLTVICSFSDSLDLDLSAIDPIGVLIDYKIEVNDSSEMFSKITDLAKRSPGFDFQITWDKKVLLYFPQRGQNRNQALVQGQNIYGIDYTNNGPTATYTLGTARSASSQGGKIVQSAAPQYRRAMATQDFGDVTDETQLDAFVQAEAKRNVTPHREITLTVIKENLDIWNEIELGDTVEVDVDSTYEHIEGLWRVVGMQNTPNDEGDEEWKLTIDDGTLSL